MALRIPLVLALMLAFAAPAAAVQPDEFLPDPVQEQRARDIGRNLRCLVCQNESIDDSDAPLARDLRLLVRERIQQGESNQEVIDFVVARYGEYVLLKPPFKASTYVLWFAPPFFFFIALLAAFLYYRRSRAEEALPEAQPQPLTDAERRRLAALLDNDKAP
ncbi:cytochrome c-type biogenesis protein [Telmatospirillum sp. J64-1]|uniref:cytochrome c-type biogenesis protein n=1 Tax=Telmatospirillum sp. J64-1 TaxID=2502183 RepID=UPI00115F02AC|nr:cytochrome c-type biogenesis protein [Telmatospirillum sp. J64-1]